MGVGKREAHGVKYDLRAAPKNTGEEQWVFLLMQKVSVQNEVEKVPFFRALKGERAELEVS